MKYIIKNCPMLYGIDIKLNKKRLETFWFCRKVDFHCKDNTDCLLKQIVEKCKQSSMPIYEGEYFLITQEYPLAKEILDLLDIQEVSE